MAAGLDPFAMNPSTPFDDPVEEPNDALTVPDAPLLTPLCLMDDDPVRVMPDRRATSMAQPDAFPPVTEKVTVCDVADDNELPTNIHSVSAPEFFVVVATWVNVVPAEQVREPVPVVPVATTMTSSRSFAAGVKDPDA